MPRIVALFVALAVSSSAYASYGWGSDIGFANAVPFVANGGQLHEAVAFRTETRFGAVFVTRDSQLVYAVVGQHAPGRIVERLIDAKLHRPVGVTRSQSRVVKLMGSGTVPWRRSNLPTYRRISLGEPWPGIELSLAVRHYNTEKLFWLEPGADADRIRMQIDGARALQINSDGSLEVTTGGGPLTFSSPVAFQEIDGERRSVDVTYTLTGGHSYGFKLGDYHAGHQVVIDPGGDSRLPR